MSKNKEVDRAFSIKNTMLEAASTVREFVQVDGVTDVDKAVAWVSLLKFNVEQNDEFAREDLERYVPETEDSIKAVEDPKERLSLWFQYSAVGLAMKRRESQAKQQQAMQLMQQMQN